MINYILALLCVVGLAVGQMLFKLGAGYWKATGSFLSISTVAALAVAFALYSLTSIIWVWVLQRVELGKIYPLMALGFVLVPAGSYLFFGERFPPQYFVGILLIVLGVVATVRA